MYNLRIHLILTYNCFNQQQNTFQVVLGTNGITTFAVFLYSDIQWGWGAQIGFNSGDGPSSFMLSEALTELTLDVDERSNIDKQGVFIFRIDSTQNAAIRSYNFYYVYA